MITNDTFCNNDFQRKEELYKLLDELVFSVGIDEISNIYNAFKKELELGWENVYQQNSPLIFRAKDEYRTLFKHFCFPKEPFYLGFDLPVWINWKAENKKIMIVAIDPLRSHEYCKEKISLSTPFGFHMNNHPKENPIPINHYKDFIEELSKNHSIYITDTYKVFYYTTDEPNDKYRSYRISDFTNPKGGFDIHQEVFKRECDIVQPDLIVTLGAIPKIWFSDGNNKKSFKELGQTTIPSNYNKDNQNCPLLPLPHLSGRSLIAAESFIGSEGTKNFGKDYATIVLKFLNKPK